MALTELEKIDKVTKVFNKMRARLFNLIEQMPFEDTKVEAYKKNIRDITSTSWTSINDVINGKEE